MQKKEATEILEKAGKQAAQLKADAEEKAKKAAGRKRGKFYLLLNWKRESATWKRNRI